MGGFNPVKSVLGTASTALSLAHIGSGKAAAKNAYAENLRDTEAQRQNQLQQLALQSVQADASRRDALKRTMAKQRAAFGGEGLSANDGSGEAVMLGLFDESEDQKNYRNQLDNLRRQSINEQADSRNRRSLLSLDTSMTGAQNALYKTLL